MFCPRCGRAINENANFCGGCGLSRAEIEKFAQAAKVNSEAAQQTAQEPQVKSEVPFGTVVNQTAETVNAPSEEKSAVDTINEFAAENADKAAPEAVEAQPVSHQTAEEAQQPEVKTESSTYTAPAGAEYHYSAQNSSNYSWQNSTQQNSTQPVTPVKNENLSTVDFIWIMIISGIPVVGLIYLIWLAIQNDNTNKRSYARASLIISVFATVVALVFTFGFIIAGI